jgi:hypothetical protein
MESIASGGIIEEARCTLISGGHCGVPFREADLALSGDEEEERDAWVWSGEEVEQSGCDRRWRDEIGGAGYGRGEVDSRLDEMRWRRGKEGERARGGRRGE